VAPRRRAPRGGSILGSDAAERSHSSTAGGWLMTVLTLLDQLRAAVERLAAPAAIQVQFLKEFGTYPSADELGLLFHDLAVAASHLRSQNVISEQALASIRGLDEKITDFSGDSYSDEWDASALERSRNWADVREMASKTLREL